MSFNVPTLRQLVKLIYDFPSQKNHNRHLAKYVEMAVIYIFECTLKLFILGIPDTLFTCEAMFHYFVIYIS